MPLVAPLLAAAGCARAVLALAGSALGRLLLAAVLLPLVACQLLPLPEVAYNFEELEPCFNGMDARRHYQEVFGYHVERFNAVMKQLSHTEAHRRILKHGGIDGLLRRLHEVPRALQRRVRRHGGGYVNHELFFRTLRPCPSGAGEADGEKTGAPEGDLLSALDRNFGSFAEFRREFSAVAKQVFGSGWVWLVADASAQNASAGEVSLRILETSANDHPLMLQASYVPLLCLDVWEHAYFGQFYNNRQRYVEAWWKLVNWEEVGGIFSLVQVESRITGVLSPSLDFASDAIAETCDNPTPGSPFRPGFASGFSAASSTTPEEAEDGFFDPAAASLASAVVLPSAPAVLVNERSGDVAADAPTPSSSSSAPDGACQALDGWLAQLRPADRGSGLGLLAPAVRCQEEGASAAVSAPAAAGEVLLHWPEAAVLMPSGPLREHLEPDSYSSLMGGLAAALLAENRRLDSRWHGYVAFLHEAFGSVQRSALFWPEPLLRALNATVGLSFLRAAGSAHRTATSLLDELPGLLAPGGTDSDPWQGAQPIFDAELHWAVTTALCRGIWDASTGFWQLLPGSELLRRGDARTANVRLRRDLNTSAVAAGAEAAGSPEHGSPHGSGWSLVATRAVVADEVLVIDGLMDDVELLVRGWAPQEANGRGPPIPLANFDDATLTVVEELASAARGAVPGEGAAAAAVAPDGGGGESRLLGEKWFRWGCGEELRRPRAAAAAAAGTALTAAAAPRALVQCASYSIRLIELAEFDSSKESDDCAERSGGSIKLGPSVAADGPADDPWQDRVLQDVHTLIAEGCDTAETRYRSALAHLPVDADGAADADAGPQEAFHQALTVAAAALQNCAVRARRKADRRARRSSKR